ncbi:ParB-like chromosome segregation protein Spo0J [Bradyrhizobium sp. AZCC 1578]|uniref:TrbI/VirB10 family protein n=1 Tax=Bradyrhizobium sp. AZCC 1578 TaxID=3117027 RepID=UPI002FEF8836
MSAKHVETSPENATGIFIPLNKLKKSPKNARKTPHSEAAIEAYAASIAAKGILQDLVVEPELDGEGTPTGFYFVTIGEGRRLAQLLRVKRKEIKKTEPIRCIVDTVNDPHEISLDENVTRENMHPADQFEAFKKLADERGFGAEEIAARFGVTPHVVRQRLRLGAVSPKLMQVYREGDLTLEQLMAFAITTDHARQEAVFDRLSYSRDASTIRKLLTETHVPATDRRARFVGIEAYTEAGGTIPAALITGIRSDLPGQITAQVTESVYDTRTGRSLLVPQGARLIGIYDSQVAFGQSRVLLVWTRLIMPNGRSIVLGRQPGADTAGNAGLQDEVDHQWDKLFKAALLSTLLGVGAELGTGADAGDATSAMIQALRRGAGDSLNQTGQQIVRRNLNIQPTLTIRPGFPVRVIVNRDLVLEPYRG